MDTDSDMIMEPVSILSSRRKVVTPLSVSPLMMAQFMGAAPRYLGRREEWRLKVPKRGIDQMARGNILKATTTNISALISSSRLLNPESLRDSGCNSSMGEC